MDKRLHELTQLRTYTENTEKEVILLFQNLQWSLNVSEKKAMVTCKYDSNHRVPLDNKDCHEAQCHLNQLGYTKEDSLLPDPADPNAPTLVKFSKRETFEIINKAANADPLFKRACLLIIWPRNAPKCVEYCEGCWGAEPLSLARLQAAYSAAERGALHQAVVSSAPSCHDLAELDLISSKDDKQSGGVKKSRLAILAELRDMKRRRTKYRVPAKTRNYSIVLRDLIRTQMESYEEATKKVIETEYGPNKYVSQRDDTSTADPDSLDVILKSERDSPEAHTFKRNAVESYRNAHRSTSRDRRHDVGKRGQYKDYTSKDSRNYNRSHRRARSSDRLQKHDRNVENSRGERNNDGENRYKDLWKDKNENYDEKHQREYSKGSSDRSRDPRHGTKEIYQDHRSFNERNEYCEGNALIKQRDEMLVKQEKITDYESDDSRRPLNRPMLYKKDKSDKDSRKTYRQRYSPDEVRGREKRSPEERHHRKDRASKSYKLSENDRRDYKRKHKEDKDSYRHKKEYDSGKRRRGFSGVAIKQERESP